MSSVLLWRGCDHVFMQSLRPYWSPGRGGKHTPAGGTVWQRCKPVAILFLFFFACKPEESVRALKSLLERRVFVCVRVMDGSPTLEHAGGDVALLPLRYLPFLVLRRMEVRKPSDACGVTPFDGCYDLGCRGRDRQAAARHSALNTLTQAEKKGSRCKFSLPRMRALRLCI